MQSLLHHHPFLHHTPNYLENSDSLQKVTLKGDDVGDSPGLWLPGKLGFKRKPERLPEELVLLRWVASL